MTTTDFFSHCWRSARHSVLGLIVVVAVAVAMVWLALGPQLAQAQTPAAEITQLRLERQPDGIYLSANVRIELPGAVEDALLKGVPMFFLAETDIVRQRWYWSDKKVASAQRHMRLAFQPLTRRWRLNVGSGAVKTSSLGLTLNLNFDSLEEALAALQRISGWKIADADQIDPDATHKVDFHFSLDLAQLPRPFQIGAFGQSDWNISASASVQIGPESTK
ncbi:MAG: DUF4390 domain-containing protein [Burkholderiaceae bacterium]